MIFFKYVIIKLTFCFQDARFIHCIKPNSEKIPIHFDDNLVSIQLNTFGAAPLVQLMNQGYSATLNYSEISEKIIPYIKYNDKLDLLDMYGYVLNAIGCGSNAYKLGKTQVFFRPKNEHFVNMFCNLNPDESKHIGIIVRKRFCDRQRRAICIALRFISMSKFKSSIKLIFFIFSQKPAKNSSFY